jgi:hypothetical protein
MRAPVAAAMFVLADRLGLGAGQLAAPATVSALASTAMRDLYPWDVESAARMTRSAIRCTCKSRKGQAMVGGLRAKAHGRHHHLDRAARAAR